MTIFSLGFLIGFIGVVMEVNKGNKLSVIICYLS